MKNKSIAKNGLFNIAYQVSNIVFSLIIAMYVSRILQANGLRKRISKNSVKRVKGRFLKRSAKEFEKVLLRKR